MRLQEKHRQEQNGVKERRRAEIVACAMQCFCEKGIETTALSDIAAYAQIGEATLYRYFSTKENLVMDCGICFWRVADGYYSQVTAEETYREKSGIEQVEALLLCTEKLFSENRSKFKFLHDLDVFLVTHPIAPDKQREYEALVDRQRPLLCDAIEKGKADGTIKNCAETEELYYTLTHTLLSLMQKLAGIGAILSGDGAVTEERRIALLRQLLLEGLRNGE